MVLHNMLMECGMYAARILVVLEMYFGCTSAEFGNLLEEYDSSSTVFHMQFVIIW